MKSKKRFERGLGYCELELKTKLLTVVLESDLSMLGATIPYLGIWNRNETVKVFQKEKRHFNDLYLSSRCINET